MAKGGARPGAGRPKGARNFKTEDKPVIKAVQTLDTGKPGRKFDTALEFAMDVINDPSADPEHKIRLAIAAMPYQHPKIGEKGATQSQLRAEAAKASATGKYAPPPPPTDWAKNTAGNG